VHTCNLQLTFKNRIRQYVRGNGMTIFVSHAVSQIMLLVAGFAFSPAYFIKLLL